MSASRLASLSYLAYRALLAHPFKLLRRRGTGEERFLANYAGEGLVPTAPGDRAVGEAASACIGCGLCELPCPVAGAAPAVRALGLHAAFRLYGRSSAELPFARGPLSECLACADGRCDAACPTGVPISRIVKHLATRAARAPIAAAAPAA
ncbi:MAG TPA: (Fe-S)-binding protein [Anaeromyxobacteraceae bacterium]|nr:(Fe-S)-binding protein [Anaeromyxobacteraceae bacterium]